MFMLGLYVLVILTGLFFLLMPIFVALQAYLLMGIIGGVITGIIMLPLGYLGVTLWWWMMGEPMFSGGN